MPYRLVEKKGVNKFWVGDDVPADALGVHISEVGPGKRAHAPHIHDGVECFFMLQGQAAMEIGDERIELGANDGIVLEPSTLHGLVNIGDVPMKYMVIIAK
jgi:mannose-6-phosphate isomerase-like protein (cupin superfamily)